MTYKRSLALGDTFSIACKKRKFDFHMFLSPYSVHDDWSRAKVREALDDPSGHTSQKE
jgi:hypothetical protein